MNIDEKLSLNQFSVDEEYAHIAIDSASDLEMLIKICPAGLYRKNEEGKAQFDYAGCLECGTCKMVSCMHGETKREKNNQLMASSQKCGKLLKRWEYPRSQRGVKFRYG